MEECEAEVISRLKAGDIGALAALVRLYQAEALDIAYLVTHNHTLSEDVVQAAFLRAYESMDNFDVGRRFAPWFLRMVVNDSLKAVTRRQTISLDDLARDEQHHTRGGIHSFEGVYEAVEAAQTKEAIREALSKLSAVNRAAIVMRYYLDLSDAEIARTLNVPQGTVRRRLHDGRKRLRDLLPAWVRR